MATKSTGHSKSQVYQNHLKTGTDQPSGVEYIADQVELAGKKVKRLNMINELYQSDLSKGGFLWPMSKAQIARWAQYGWDTGAMDYIKKSDRRASFSEMTDFQYDQAAKRGVKREILGERYGMFNRPEPRNKKRIK